MHVAAIEQYACFRAADRRRRSVHDAGTHHVRVRLGGPFRRFVAHLLDLALVAVLLVAGVLSLDDAVRWLGCGVRPAPVAFLVLSWGYGAICESVFSGQTAGKRAMGLRVLSDRGVPITAAQAILRNLVGAVDGLLPFCGLLGLSSMLLSARFQRLGDLAAGTMVIKEERSPRAGLVRSWNRGCEVSSTVCPCGLPPVRALLGRFRITSAAVTGLAADYGKRWPSRWLHLEGTVRPAGSRAG